MPYRKYNGRKNGRPGYKRCAKMVYGDAQKALAMARYVKGLVNVEFKEINTQRNGASLSTTISITTPSILAQGDLKTQRGGNKVRFKSIHRKGFFSLHASATTSMVRLMIVLDKQCNGAVFSIADLLEDSTVGDSIVSPRDVDNMNRFVVLSDKTYKLADGGGNQLIQFNIYKRINLPIRYDGTGATVANMTSNALYLVSFSNEATNTPIITDFCRIRFIDN